MNSKKLAIVLNTHSPTTTKMIRFNNSVFMTKESRKEIMKRWKLRNKFNRNRNQCNFIFQRHYFQGKRKKYHMKI